MFKPILIGFLQASALCVFIHKGVKTDCPSPPTNCYDTRFGFFLYNKQYGPDGGQDGGQDGYQLDLKDENTIKDAVVSPNVPFKFVIHGFTGSRNNERMVKLRNAYFEQRDWNIIFLDYKLLAESCYMTTFESVPILASCGAQFLKRFTTLKTVITFDQFHFIGFSIGAHIAAQISNEFPRNTFKRITGLDPALPLFFPPLVHSRDKLSRDNAKFVDVIHTNAGIYRGVFSSNAHVDIYANGGTWQPGCHFYDTLCSHARALDYFTESINSDIGFRATKCDYFITGIGICYTNSENPNVILAGEPCTPVKPEDEGSYNFETNSTAPFTIKS